MTDVFQEFADWKTQKGIPAKVVTIDDIAANYLGCDVQEKIHNFLADVHQCYGSLFILFGGDVNVVPARMVPGKHNGTKIDSLLCYPVDLYYVAIILIYLETICSLVWVGQFPQQSVNGHTSFYTMIIAAI